MREKPGLRYPFALVLASAVACATATEEDIPPAEVPEGPGNTGGTVGNGTGGTEPGSGGTTSTGTGGATSSGGSKSSGTGGGKATGGTGFGTGGTGFGSGGTGFGSGGSAGSGGSKSVACPDAREPATSGAAQGDSGSFGTLEGVCYFVEGNFNSWNCSNLGGRTISVNGTPLVMCGGPLPEKVDGGYYFEFGASTSTDYTSFYWYTS